MPKGHGFPKSWSMKDREVYVRTHRRCMNRPSIRLVDKTDHCVKAGKDAVRKRRSGGLDQVRGETPMWLRLVLGAGAGAAAGTLVWLVAKKELERDFGQGAARLQTRLERSGTALQRETRVICGDAAEAQVRAELASIGVTRGLVSDARRLMRRIDAYLP